MACHDQCYGCSSMHCPYCRGRYNMPWDYYRPWPYINPFIYQPIEIKPIFIPIQVPVKIIPRFDNRRWR